MCNRDASSIQNSTNMEGQINVLIWTCITAGFILDFHLYFGKYGNLSARHCMTEKKTRKLFMSSSSSCFLGFVLAIL
jgi:sec-independent protein translocase protein TatC